MSLIKAQLSFIPTFCSFWWYTGTDKSYQGRIRIRRSWMAFLQSHESQNQTSFTSCVEQSGACERRQHILLAAASVGGKYFFLSYRSSQRHPRNTRVLCLLFMFVWFETIFTIVAPRFFPLRYLHFRGSKTENSEIDSKFVRALL